MGRVEKMPKIDVIIPYYHFNMNCYEITMQHDYIETGVSGFLSYHTIIYINQTCIMWTVIGVFLFGSPNPKLGRK